MPTLSKKQNEYIRNANKRWNLKVGAVRSGKSFVDVSYIIPARLRQLKNEKGLNVIIGVSKSTIERNILQPMREIYTDSVVGTINSQNIANVCGVPVYCLGAEKVSQVAKIQGASIKYCYGDEVAKWNKELFAMLQSRLDKPYSYFDGALNPESPGHWLKQFIDRPDIDAYIQKYTIFDNPFLPKEFVDNLCKEYAGTVYYGRYIEGEWTLAEGLIYPMYQDAIEAAPEAQPSKYCLSVDYGTMNAFSAGLWGKYGDVWYRISEYYYSGRDTGVQKTDEEYAVALDALIEPIMTKREEEYKEMLRLGYSAVFEKMETIIDPSAASFITLLRKKSWYKVTQADNAVLDGIRDTTSAIQTGKIKISPSCKNWIKEAQGYVWDASCESEDKPVKVNDHAMDDTRYFVKTKRIAVHRSNYVPSIYY